MSRIKITGIFLFIIFFSMTVKTYAQKADAITGVWLTEDKDGRVQIYKQNGKYYGKLIWGKDIYEADGKTSRKDVENQNEKLRNRTLLNMVLLADFSYDDGVWTGGTVYDPKSGKTYSSKIKLQGNSLDLRGYIGTPMLGRSTTWTRLN